MTIEHMDAGTHTIFQRYQSLWQRIRLPTGITPSQTSTATAGGLWVDT